MKYTSRSMRRRRNTDQWEVSLSHKDPLTGEMVRSYHTIEAKTEKQAAKARDELILELERKGGAFGSKITVQEFMDLFLDYKEKSGTIEPSTVRGYQGENRWIVRYLGDVNLSELSIPAVAKWMSNMASDGYAPKSCAKAFRLFKQALNWAKAQDLITKNPCDFCKPPKRDKTPINALDKAERTRMLKLARAALGTKLGLAVELALTTGMRRGEVCGLRWSDLNDDGTVTVSRALANADVDPDAKKAAVSKVEEAFDYEFSDMLPQDIWPDMAPAVPTAPETPAQPYTVEQLEAMLAAARIREARGGGVISA